MTNGASPRVCVISEGMSGALDEGIRKFARSLLGALAEQSAVLGVSPGPLSFTEGVEAVPAGHFFLSRRLRERLIAFDPDGIVYVPSASSTWFSFLRCCVLRSYRPRAELAMAALQERRHRWPARKLLSRLQPDVLFAQGPANLSYLTALGCRAEFLPAGVNLERFRPADAGWKAALRQKYGLPADAFLVLHVGHIKEGRNVRLLRRLQGETQAVLVAAGSTGRDAALLTELVAAGVIVIDSYLEDVQEIYQASDCYLFPARSPDSSIDVPLSVLEAMACNLPVVTFPFGGLPWLFRDEPWFRFAREEGEMLAAIEDVMGLTHSCTRQLVAPYSWRNVAAYLLRKLLPERAIAYGTASTV